jgi:hypothetical protein
MNGYQLGADIAEIKHQLEQIFAAVAGNNSAPQNQPCACAGVKFGAELKRSGKDDSQREVITFTQGRIDVEECECREQTLQIWDDGEFKHISVHHNHSKLIDDGDTHRLRIQIRAGDEIIESIGGTIFVPRQRDRTMKIEGFSEALKRRFRDLTTFDGSMGCE